MLGQKFSITKFRVGYALDELDLLLDQVMEALKSEEDPAQITGRILGASLAQTRWRDGYSVDQVDDFLARLVEELRALPALR